MLTLGQNTGIDWQSVDFVFVPQGTPSKSSGLPAISFTSYPANTAYSLTGLASGQITEVDLPVNGVSVPVTIGTYATGAIWVRYTTLNQTNYTLIATLNVKAS